MANMSGSGTSGKPGQNQESQKGGTSQHSQQGNRPNDASNDASRQQGNKNQPSHESPAKGGQQSGSGSGNK
jgi:hypothetical protein